MLDALVARIFEKEAGRYKAISALRQLVDLEMLRPTNEQVRRLIAVSRDWSEYERIELLHLLRAVDHPDLEDYMAAMFDCSVRTQIYLVSLVGMWHIDATRHPRLRQILQPNADLETVDFR